MRARPSRKGGSRWGTTDRDRDDDRQHAKTAELFESSLRRGRKADPAHEAPRRCPTRTRGAGGGDAAAVGAVFGGMVRSRRRPCSRERLRRRGQTSKRPALGLGAAVPDNHKGAAGTKPDPQVAGPRSYARMSSTSCTSWTMRPRKRASWRTTRPDAGSFGSRRRRGCTSVPVRACR